MFSTALYRKLPPSLQAGLINARGYLRKTLRENNSLARGYLRELLKLQWLHRAELQAYQLAKLKDVLRFAERFIPYYQDLFRDIGFNHTRLRVLEDLQSIPFTTKQDLRLNADKFRPLFPLSAMCIVGHTSGTTGTPTKIYQHPASLLMERAFQLRSLLWCGFRPGMKRIWLRGDVIVPIDQNDPPYWRYNKSENLLMMSSYHMSPQTLPVYIARIRDFGPDMITAYPSSIFTIASFMKNNGYEPIRVGRISTSSETLFSKQREIIEEMFVCKVFDWYGNAEKASAIGTCENGNYHIIEDYGYTELIDHGPGQREIVSTGFINRCMPLIRFRTNDVVGLEQEDESLCSCGRYFRKVNLVIGRTDDAIFLPDGRRIAGPEFIFEGRFRILKGQIYQHRDYSVDIMVVPDVGYDPSDTDRLIRSAEQRLGHRIPIKVKCVKELIHTANGKIKTVTSEIGGSL